MLFNSFEFVVFLAAFLLLYGHAPRQARPALLLAGSYLFYAGWRPSFVLLLLFTTAVDFIAARVIDAAPSQLVRRASLAFALAINLGLLAAFKYLDFALAGVIGAVGFFGIEMSSWMLGWVLPVGISFYTFQSIGYTLDVYHRRLPAERNLLRYATYVAFFPQLVAGPIERAAHLLPQLRAPQPASPDRVRGGLWLIGWGLFKKMCIADLVAPFVAGVYSQPAAFNGSYTLLATLLFALQIYCDFSGYSDIAVGVARLLGIDLMINFRQPYFSRSVSEFWRRWHISLSNWLRDHLYRPLGGSRGGRWQWVRNIFIVFLLSGLWHGAQWTFVAWGLLHAAAMLAEGLWRRAPVPRGTLASAAGALWTLAVVGIGWVLFRAASLADAWQVIGSWAAPGPLAYGAFKALGLGSFELLLLVLNIGLLLAIDAGLAACPERLARLAARSNVALPAALALTFHILLFGVFGHVEFVYFQF